MISGSVPDVFRAVGGWLEQVGLVFGVLWSRAVRFGMQGYMDQGSRSTLLLFCSAPFCVGSKLRGLELFRGGLEGLGLKVTMEDVMYSSSVLFFLLSLPGSLKIC